MYEKSKEIEPKNQPPTKYVSTNIIQNITVIAIINIQPRKYKYDLKSPGHKPKNQAGTISRSGKPRFPWTVSEISGSASSIDSLQTPSSPNPDLVSSPKPTQHHHHHPSDEDEETSQSPEEFRTNNMPSPPALPPKDCPPPLPPKDNPLPLPPRSKTPPNLKSDTSMKNSIPLPPKESSGKNLLPLPPKGGKQHGRHSVPAIIDSDLITTSDKAPPRPPKAKIS